MLLFEHHWKTVSRQFSKTCGIISYGSGWRKDVVNQCLEFGLLAVLSVLSWKIVWFITFSCCPSGGASGSSHEQIKTHNQSKRVLIFNRVAVFQVELQGLSMNRSKHTTSQKECWFLIGQLKTCAMFCVVLLPVLCCPLAYFILSCCLFCVVLWPVSCCPIVCLDPFHVVLLSLLCCPVACFVLSHCLFCVVLL